MNPPVNTIEPEVKVPTENPPKNRLTDILKKRIRNRYTLVHTQLFFSLLSKRKISFKKLFNASLCHAAYWLKLKKSAPGPLMVSIELWNECNINCMFCRDKKGKIYDQDAAGPGEPIMKGRMTYEMFTSIIDQVKDHVLVAVLYTNGEPLMYKDLAKCVKYCTDRNVATIVASNGTLMTEEKARELLAAGLDLIKIQLSGFTQDVYNVQVRNGDVEKIKEGIKIYNRLNRQGDFGSILFVDYILYNYNRHQLPLIRQFCDGLGLILNTRPGNPSHGLEDKEPKLNTEGLPLKVSCDWLWKAMQVNYNGDILQCCEGVVFSGVKPYDRLNPGKTDLLGVWNGPAAINMRETLRDKGRGAIPICRGCTRKGISFKW